MRLRLGQWTAEELTPDEALKKYLETRQDLSQERAETLLQHGKKLIEQQQN